MSPRKVFPTTGIFAVRGGLASTHFLTEADRGRYRYVTPSGRPRGTYWGGGLLDRRSLRQREPRHCALSRAHPT